jgi:hypothetical protein
MEKSRILTERTECFRDSLMLTLGTFTPIVPFIIIIGHGGPISLPRRHFMSPRRLSRALANMQARRRIAHPALTALVTVTIPTVTPAEHACFLYQDWFMVALQSQHVCLWWVRKPNEIDSLDSKVLRAHKSTHICFPGGSFG